MSEEIARLFERYPALAPCRADIERTYAALQRCFASGGKLLLCGNGGSAADCEHIVGELMKSFKRPRPAPQSLRHALRAVDSVGGDTLADRLQGALPAISLASHSGLLTATANDISAEMMFAQQVYGYGRPGDVLLGISTSGNSTNVVNALKVGCAMGLVVVGLTGRSGGALPALCEITIRAPADAVDEIQEYHLAIYHALCAELEAAFFA